ncbi:MAG: sugar phosphate isomerase/epimerase [Planctomycetota bacterium]|nr:MAG: sugar phosphate isomerase/epimerase [Planctomycetota bacterium]
MSDQDPVANGSTDSEAAAQGPPPASRPIPDRPAEDPDVLNRRELFRIAALAGPLAAAQWAAGGASVVAAADDRSDAAEGRAPAYGKPRPDRGDASAPRRYAMKKSFNLWALPYPDAMSLADCFELAKQAGFDGVEINFDLEGDVSAASKPRDLDRVRELAAKIGIEISGLCSFLFWPYPLTSNDPQKRARGRELAAQMVRAARRLGTRNLLVVPGAVYIPWAPEDEPVPNDVCWQRATEAVRSLIPLARECNVSLNIENIFANGFLLSPDDMNRFVDQFDSDVVGIHFDTGNIMQYQFPEHWIPLCGRRIRNVHFKEYSKRAGTEFTLDSFRPLLDGTTNWPAVIAALDRVGYRGYLTFEYFRPFPHWPESLIYQTSDALDRMLGRKA